MSRVLHVRSIIGISVGFAEVLPSLAEDGVELQEDVVVVGVLVVGAAKEGCRVQGVGCKG